jgi:acetyltransferase-like isoleucine patch superfamily enzyme
MSKESAITARHMIDCTNEIRIGAFSTVAGYYTQMLTHSINLSGNYQDSKPIVIGDYCFVGTNCVILGGAVLPSYCVLGAKAFLAKALQQEWTLYAGIPAKSCVPIPPDGKYFLRKQGRVE